VPVTTLRRPKEQGGLALPDIGAKCRTLLLTLIWKLSNKDGSLTAALMHHWNLTGAVPNPPLARRFPTKVAHFRKYNIDMAYVAQPDVNESTEQFKRRLYGVFRTMTAKIEDIAEMRIIRKYPDTLWERVWKNLHAAVLPASVKSTWYRAIHDIGTAGSYWPNRHELLCTLWTHRHATT